MIFYTMFLCPAMCTHTTEKDGVCFPCSGNKSAFWITVEETLDEDEIDVHVEKLDGLRFLPAGGPLSHSLS